MYVAMGGSMVVAIHNRYLGHCSPLTYLLFDRSFGFDLNMVTPTIG